MDDYRIERFLTAITQREGIAALSDAKEVQLGDADRVMVIEEGDEVVAVGASARHLHDDGTHHWAIETALEPGLRFPSFEDRLLESALDLAPHVEPVSVWSHRRSLDAALERAGFAVVRELGHYVVGLPISGPVGGLAVRPLETQDIGPVLAINREAFAGHREAASLDEAEFQQLLKQRGLGSEGFLVAEEGGGVIGFCWTRVHENRDGEIYRIAASPTHQGRGLGRSLVLAGFEYLSKQPGVRRGTLWVDRANVRAVALYEGLGMAQDSVNREFVQQPALIRQRRN
jgi:mycothiol synthase